MIKPSETSFINIHTHYKPLVEGEFVIRNAYMRLTVEQIGALNYPVSAGLHPWHLNSMKPNECMDRLVELATSPNVLAIGEIGVDRAIEMPVSRQLEYFDAQLTVAKAVQKPVIIHAVRSYSDIIPFLKKSRVPFIFHQFHGNEQQAKELLKHGAILSFGKNLFQPATASLFTNLPPGSFLLETDHAYPLTIAAVYHQACELKKTGPDELKKLQFDTFAALSGVK